MGGGSIPTVLGDYYRSMAVEGRMSFLNVHDGVQDLGQQTVPDGSIVLNTLVLVEYLDAEGLPGVKITVNNGHVTTHIGLITYAKSYLISAMMVGNLDDDEDQES